jgi:flagellar motor switch protein FliN
VNQIDATALSQLVQLLSSAFSKVSAEGVSPKLSQVDPPTAAEYEWHCVQFDEAAGFRIFAGAVKPSDEGAYAAKANTVQRLNTAFSVFAEHLSAEIGHKTTSHIEDTATKPDTSQISLKVQGSTEADDLILLLDPSAVAWFVANIPAPQKQRNTRSFMIDTLMDVELPVSILLATREASLNDVLQWGPGAIVEFEAGLGDPVDVIVNKQTVARGSVVLVDGNYGVRITEVLAETKAIGERAGLVRSPSSR